MHVAEAKRQLGTRISWISDGMDNAIKHAFGNAPNSEFVIDKDNRVVRSRRWSEPEDLRRDLEDLVGKVGEPTSPSTLTYLKAVQPLKEAATGVVPRVQTPTSMEPLIFEAVATKKGKTFYAKLRVEAESTVLRTGTGKLYLGFYLDPLYRVHWNNLAEPLRYRIENVQGLTLSATEGVGPTPVVEADADPREFLLEVTDARVGAGFDLLVEYFACNDEAGWCVPVSQKYKVTVKRDADGGSRRNRQDGRPRSGMGGVAPPVSGGMIRGLIGAVDPRKQTINVRTRGHESRTYFVPDEAHVRINDVPGSIDLLEVGYMLQIKVHPDRKQDGLPVVMGMNVRSRRP